MSLTAMVIEGGNQLDDLKNQIQVLDKQTAEIESELAAIQQAREERAQKLQQARLLVTQAEAKHTEASGVAKLAHGKPRQKQAIKDVAQSEKALNDARGVLSTLEREEAEADQVDTTREEALHNQLHLHGLERETHQNEIHQVTKGLDRVRAELGHERYSAFMAAYEKQNEKVDALLSQVVAAQAALENLRQDGMRELSEWQDYHARVERLGQSTEDPTVLAAEASIGYIEAMIELAPKVSNELLQLPVFHIPHIISSGSPMDVILVHRDEILAARYNQRDLSRHRERLLQFRDEYREYLADGGKETK